MSGYPLFEPQKKGVLVEMGYGWWPQRRDVPSAGVAGLKGEVGRGFGGQRSYFVNDFFGLTLMFRIRTAGVGGSWPIDVFWCTGFTSDNPEN